MQHFQNGEAGAQVRTVRVHDSSDEKEDSSHSQQNAGYALDSGPLPHSPSLRVFGFKWIVVSTSTA
jgi:hypothetical protein